MTNLFAESSFFDALSKSDHLSILLLLGALIVASLLMALIKTISQTIVKVRRDAAAAELKHAMLERGMSAEEIKTILEAGTNAGH